MLIFGNLKVGREISIADGLITIMILRNSRGSMSIGIDAPREISILLKERNGNPPSSPDVSDPNLIPQNSIQVDGDDAIASDDLG